MFGRNKNQSSSQPTVNTQTVDSNGFVVYDWEGPDRYAVQPKGGNKAPSTPQHETNNDRRNKGGRR